MNAGGLVLRQDPRKLDAWIVAYRKGGDVHSWTLLQLAGRGRAQTVRTYRPDHVGDNFAADVLGTAQQDADDTSPGQPTTYALVAVSEQGEELGRTTMRVSGRARDVSEAGPEEEPSIVGMVGQIMRHEEARMRLRAGLAGEVVDNFRAITEDMRKELERKAGRIKELEERLDKSFDARQNLADKTHEREADAAERKARAERNSRLLGTFLSLLPMLIAQRAAANGQAPALDVELAAFAKTLEPEQLFRICEVLTPPQQAAFAALMKKYVPAEPENTAKNN